MNGNFLKEFGVNAVFGLAVFGWVFGQSPLDQASRAPVAPLALVKSDERGDDIPNVRPAKVRDFSITIEQVALHSPDQHSIESPPLVEVTATTLKLRAHPTSQSPLIRAYPTGARFERIGQNGNWLNVRNPADGTSGWMHANYLQPVSGT
ncbi:MAG: SH3 domain-containing protein [Rhizobiales bacterium]|nr:SH3 domain-containing protein [Hyphomicrobiales bacterium]